jgi:carbon starvation protein
MIAFILVTAVILFVLAYRWYGAWISRQFELDDRHAVPSETMYDGTDYVPAQTAVLFGHHFSSIAGAGPVIGPILAGLFFGWVPALLWIVVGSIFVGGVHDFGSMVASVRHKARSIAELARQYMSPLSYRLFLAFIWLTLVYVIVVFLDLTAVSFIDVPGGGVAQDVQGTGVAVASGLFLLLAIGLGLVNQRTKIPLWVSTALFVPVLVLVAIWSSGITSDGSYMPLIAGDARETWSVLLLAYCFVASVTPVWALLHPRDYLSSFMLYLAVLGGGAGLMIGSIGGTLTATYPAFVNPSDPVFQEIPHLGPLFPILFITIACGACSGFHSMVSSGTTAKQVSCESDARRIGYGGMLTEGVVAVISLACVMMLAFNAQNLGQNPVTVYAQGMGTFLSSLGIPLRVGTMLGLLTLSTFLLTTLDTCTRLGRYVLQELLQWENSVAANRVKATLITLVIPAVMAYTTYTTPSGQVLPVWRAIWPVFGSTNQLLAGLALLAVTFWMKRTGRRWLFVAVPTIFMVTMTMSALVLQVSGAETVMPVRVIASALLVLGSVLVVEALRIVRRPPVPRETIVIRQAPATIQGD